MMKFLSVFLVLVFLLSLAGCQTEGGQFVKQSIFDFVIQNKNEILLACDPADPNALLALVKIKEVDVVEGYVLAYCEGRGIVPSSQYYGFYYSKDDRPVAVFDGWILCNTDDLREEGRGYQYSENGNVFYTEKIADNLWFYSASF